MKCSVPTTAVASECYDYYYQYEFAPSYDYYSRYEFSPSYDYCNPYEFAPSLRSIIRRKALAAAAVEAPAGAGFLFGWLRSGSMYDHKCPFLTPWYSKPSGQPCSGESTKSQPGSFSFFAHEVHDQIKLMKQAQQGPADEYSSNETDASFPQNDQADVLQLGYSTQWQHFYDQLLAEESYDELDLLEG